MILLDIVRTSTRYKVETIKFKGQRYLQIAKLFKTDKHESGWMYQTSILLDDEATDEFIRAFQKIDVLDILIELEKEVK